MPTPIVDAATLVTMLAQRHALDVFVGECKMGSSWNGCKRLDAWAMLKTWSPFTTIGYEIKVSRSDFLKDNKWHEYLRTCHEFYFVCPRGLIDPAELPVHVGLLVTAGSRLKVVRKSTRRDPEPAALVELMAYVLMSRTRTVANMHEADGNQLDSLELWRDWLAQKADRQAVGHAASKRLREIVNEARADKRHAESERDRLQGVKDTLAALGFDGNVSAHTVERAASRKPLLAALAYIKRQIRQIDLGIDRELAAVPDPERDTLEMADAMRIVAGQ